MSVKKIRRTKKTNTLGRGFPSELDDYVENFLANEDLPFVDPEKFNQLPVGDDHSVLPEKARKARQLATPVARLVFEALYDQHQDFEGRRNGLIFASYDDLMKLTGVGNRNHISNAVKELECRGLIRRKPGSGGRGKRKNCFLLACFADFMGNPPLADYETCGVPSDKPMANSQDARNVEREMINARFNQAIQQQVKIYSATDALKDDVDIKLH